MSLVEKRPRPLTIKKYGLFCQRHRVAAGVTLHAFGLAVVPLV
jgi:hypothetical protein